MIVRLRGWLLRHRVKVWFAAERAAETRLRRAYDALAAHDSRH